MLPTAYGPAKDLDHLYLTLRPEPLMEPEEFKQYYREQVNHVRGEDTVARLSLKLQQAYRTLPFKAFLMGHPGVGKSTEISRLLERVKDQHVGVRLSIATELNPASFKVFDVLLLMLIRLAEEADRMKAVPLGGMLSEHLVSGIKQWFGTEQVKKSRTETTAVGVEAGAGVKGDSLWAGLLGLFASAKAEMKYAADRKTETIEYRLQRLPELVDLCNRLIDVCNQTVLEKTGQEWLLVVEDLDKTGISPQQLQELFIQYGTVFQDLRVNMIFTIPVWLAYSPEANRLPFERYMIHDTPVYDRSHGPHEDGRSAVQTVLEARVSPSIFSEGQMTRLIVASGGNLRDLFALVLDAGEGARARNPAATLIGPDDAKAAVNKMRREYRMKLGQSPYDAHPIPYSDKSARLLAVYDGAPDSDIPDPVLYSLLRGRAIQEFNGDGWYGVHPLVVDILKEQEHLKPQDPGGTD
jgi:GTPase SAR1 family protein